MSKINKEEEDCWRVTEIEGSQAKDQVKEVIKKWEEKHDFTCLLICLFLHLGRFKFHE